ncbi:hypothetical protein ABZP36_023208 [Zizania latifolia]
MMVPEENGKHQDAEHAKSHSPECSEEAVQDGKHQEGERPKNIVPENPEMGQQEPQHQASGIPTAHKQENTEIAEKRRLNYPRPIYLKVFCWANKVNRSTSTRAANCQILLSQEAL